MAVPLRLLIIEDSSDDAILMVREIQRGDFDVEYSRVETEEAVRTALAQEPWDLILCDYTLPSFNALRALELVRASDQDIPFIILSGSISEEMAVAALRGGAHDFMLKGNLARLVPAIQRELREAQSRREKKLMEDALRDREALFRLVVDAAPASIMVVDPEGKITLANARTEEMFGYRKDELIGRPIERLLPETLRKQHTRERQHYMGHPDNRQLNSRHGLVALHKDGRQFPVEIGLTPFQSAEGQSILALVVDITERQRAETALLEAETRYRLLVERIPAVTYVISSKPPYHTLYVSPQIEQLLGYSPQEWRADPDLWEHQIHPDDRERVLEADRRSRENGHPFIEEYRVIARNGRICWLHDETYHIEEPGVEPFSQGIEFDITERKQAEEAVRQAEARYRILVEQLPMIFYTNPATDMGQTTYVSPQVEQILGYTVQEWMEDSHLWERILHPDDRAAVLDRVERCNLTGEPFDMEFRMVARDGHIVWFRDQTVRVNDSTGAPSHWQGFLTDTTERKRRDRELEAIARLSTVLRETQTVSEILPRLLDETLSVLDAEEGSIWLRDPMSRRVQLALQRSWSNQPVSRYPFGESIPAIVVDTGRVILEREFCNDVRIPEDQRRRIPQGLGGACVPLSAAGQTVGALFVNVRLPREMTPGDLQVLRAMADLGGNAIHRARLFEETVKHLDRLAALRAVDIAISSSFDLRMVLNLVLEHVIKQLRVDAASVLLLKPESLALEYAAGQGFWTRSIESTSLNLGEGLPARAVLERQMVYVDDLKSRTGGLYRPYLADEEKFVTYHAVPLVAKGKVKGVLEVLNRTSVARDAEWMQFLEAMAGQTAIAVDSASTFQDLQRSNLELALAYDATIEGWSHALDLRDKETEGHTLRVTEAATRLAQAMGLGDESLTHIRRGGLLHDIGKMGVPDSILLKPGKLTDEEWVVMRTHPQLAYDMLVSIPYLRPALDIPYCHHEKWDGTGYPRGLKGKDIPLAARIFAVVDVWDALSSDRPYRPAWKAAEVMQYLQEQAGRHFDPEVVRVFLEVMEQAGR